MPRGAQCVHELPREHCAHCAPRQDRNRSGASTSRPFAAFFDSNCDECGNRIHEGDMIVMRYGVAVHEEHVS
jgi:hypothetical protein